MSPACRRSANPETAATPLPPELPRIDVEVIPHGVRRAGLDAFERIGEETNEVVEHRPASLVVVRIVRPKFVRARSSEAMLRDASTQPYLCVDATGVLVQAEEQCHRAHLDLPTRSVSTSSPRRRPKPASPGDLRALRVGANS